MTWNHRFNLVSIASAALMLSASAAGAQTVFGFNVNHIDRPGGVTPWHGLESYTFKSEDGDESKSITVEALDLTSSSSSTPTLAEGYDSAGSIGLLSRGDTDERKVYLSEALAIELGQPAMKLAVTLKDLGKRDRQVLWTVSGEDAAGKHVEIKGNIQGRGVPDSQPETFIIDQAKLESTPGQPAGGFKGPVAIEAITLSSIEEFGTDPDFGNIRFDQSFFLVAIEATAFSSGEGEEDEEEEEVAATPSGADDDDDDDDAAASAK